MDVPQLPLSRPIHHGFLARTLARMAPLLVLAVAMIWWIGRGPGRGLAQGRGFSEAIALSVAPTAGGRLAELTVSIGQPVKAGDVIARLDGRSLDLQRTKLQAERALLAAKLATGVSRQDDAVMRAEVWRLRTAAESQQDQASLTDLEREVTRLDLLLDDQLVKASDVEPSRRMRDGMKARVDIYDRAREAGQAGLDANLEGTNRRAVVEVRTAPLREALKVKDLQLEQLTLQVAALTLRAPGDGVIGAINRRPGEMLAAGEVAVVVIAHRPGLFEIYLSEREQRVPHVGDVAHLSRAGMLTHVAEGRVVEIAPGVTEAPLRLRLTPHIPVWGRRVIVDASQSPEMRAVPPGEEVHFRL